MAVIVTLAAVVTILKVALQNVIFPPNLDNSTETTESNDNWNKIFVLWNQCWSDVLTKRVFRSRAVTFHKGIF